MRKDFVIQLVNKFLVCVHHSPFEQYWIPVLRSLPDGTGRENRVESRIELCTRN